MIFSEKLLARQMAVKSFLCVGLDPVPDRMPQHLFKGDSRDDVAAAAYTFCCAIVDATAQFVCAFKPNSAFYERLGWQGSKVLEELIRYIKTTYPDIPVILDAKRGDVPRTNIAYADAAFGVMESDILTLSPYLGGLSLSPFLDWGGGFSLCKTSNDGAEEIQDLMVMTDRGSMRLFEVVARKVANSWNRRNNCGLVVGATYSKDLAIVRGIVDKNMPLLIPGIGAQGGSVEQVMEANKGGTAIINSSSGIIFAGSDQHFAQAAAEKAFETMEAIQKCS